MSVLLRSVRMGTNGLLTRVDFWIGARGHERQSLWRSLIRDLAEMPILVESEFVGAQCQINDHENVERIWAALVEDFQVWQSQATPVEPIRGDGRACHGCVRTSNVSLWPIVLKNSVEY